MRRPPGPGSPLHRRLEDLVRRLGPSHLHPDPLEVVREYRGRADREVAGLLAAGLAFGGVETILRSVRAAAAPLGPRPAEALAGTGDRDLRRALRGFRHRWVDGDDAAALLAAARRLREEHGSLEAAFLAGDPGGETVEGGMEAFAAALRAADPGFARRGAAGFFAAPSGGSACKRSALYLRWMVRPGPVDTGAWRGVDPARLVIPLDTHLSRVTRRLGLLRRRTGGWKAVLEATAALRRLCPEDPVRYDFPLLRVGMAERVPGRLPAGEEEGSPGVTETGRVPY